MASPEIPIDTPRGRILLSLFHGFLFMFVLRLTGGGFEFSAKFIPQFASIIPVACLFTLLSIVSWQQRKLRYAGMSMGQALETEVHTTGRIAAILGAAMTVVLLIIAKLFG